ncbi:ASPARAGINE SYNTHETASE DOMAIN-CONTAINING PROTEIN 1 [Salix viminalis]|uniref:ASPARAGINE SYNTHETASE DOMAIN-CONTAINING PROTEIN 1 n=1 Tax=Salix viminalis TaxID=40686 RepID=A0A9Q0U008_SALVM|nr:ASPARAGINE SYNTHETASE DOMAIN-CONTAINING PROTEIN 1 [Salix viminalis]
MCGIALIVSGIRIDLSPSTLFQSSQSRAISYSFRNIGELQFIGATLQLRGLNPIIQPFVDSYGNVLIYNGEIFGGIHVLALLLDMGCNSVPNVFSTIKGPWAIIYWQESSRTLWFGRDAFGRRSLVVHWPTVKDSRFLLSSVSPFSSVYQSSDFEVENGTHHNFWEELSCGIYSLSMDASKLHGYLAGEVKKHEWGHPASSDIVTFESGPDQTMVSLPAHNVLSALRKSVILRASQYRIFEAVRCYSRQEEHVPVAVLFSGGLDSMILSALLDECLDPSYGIDLLNVSFDGQSAPDRISAKAGVKELRRIAPLRRWKLVEIDSDLSKLTLEMKHVMSLINPANTYMDLNIGVALWLAASGDGWVSERPGNNSDEDQQRLRYKSEARIVLVGSGADEQCAGYGRHRTKYRCGSWHGLNEEMKLDVQRIWKRNMGRDDRCIADNGKEARFPFLDEDVIKVLLDIPLWEVTNLDQPSGTGDKKILREVARMLGLHEAAVLPKRAIQFGSRIARESNRNVFGSNRAANQASAGSVVINRS